MCANSFGFNMILGVEAVAEGVVLEAHAGTACQSTHRPDLRFFEGKLRSRELKGTIGNLLSVS